MTNDARAIRHAALSVEPRTMRFPYDELDDIRFFDNNALKSAFLVALSSTFPPGEQEFIESVRLYRNEVTDPQLKAQIRGFIGQEGQHSHQHREVNRQFTAMGLDAIRLENHLQKDIKRLRHEAGRKFRLAMTVGMEHLTAIMAAHVLENADQFDSLAEPMKDLLLWHAVEEIEHKAVAFDVYMHCVGDQKYLRKILRLATMLFTVRISCYSVALLWWSRTFPRPREWTGFLRYLFGKRGMIRGIRKPYMEYYRDGFHPWDQDNGGFVEHWKQRFYKSQFDKSAGGKADSETGATITA